MGHTAALSAFITWKTEILDVFVQNALSHHCHQWSGSVFVGTVAQFVRNNHKCARRVHYFFLMRVVFKMIDNILPKRSL